jgi:hypothetical protein
MGRTNSAIVGAALRLRWQITSGESSLSRRHLSRSEHATVGVTGVALHLAREEIRHLNIRDFLRRISG